MTSIATNFHSPKSHLTFICAFCGFQAEHPFVWQIKQRKSWKPRLLVWGSLYSGVAGAIALWVLNTLFFSSAIVMN